MDISVERTECNSNHQRLQPLIEPSHTKLQKCGIAELQNFGAERADKAGEIPQCLNSPIPQWQISFQRDRIRGKVSYWAAVQEREFEALRATIRQRGTVRMILLPVTFGLWGGAAIATTAAVALPIATLLPLLVLAAGFEAIYALHTNVERIGRYLQVFHETDGGWEHVSMAFGERFPGQGSDALFSNLFLIATVMNYLPVALGGTVPELVAVGVLHLILALHIGTARRRASKQRQLDLERFEALRRG